MQEYVWIRPLQTSANRLPKRPLHCKRQLRTYSVEAVSLKTSNNTLKIMIFVNVKFWAISLKINIVSINA